MKRYEIRIGENGNIIRVKTQLTKEDIITEKEMKLKLQKWMLERIQDNPEKEYIISTGYSSTEFALVESAKESYTFDESNIYYSIKDSYDKNTYDEYKELVEWTKENGEEVVLRKSHRFYRLDYKTYTDEYTYWKEARKLHDERRKFRGNSNTDEKEIKINDKVNEMLLNSLRNKTGKKIKDQKVRLVKRTYSYSYSYGKLEKTTVYNVYYVYRNAVIYTELYKVRQYKY